MKWLKRVWKWQVFFFFYRNFQPITSATDNSFLSSNIKMISETQKVGFIGSTSYKIGQKPNKNWFYWHKVVS